MDPALYRTLTTKRGIKYHYFVSLPTDHKGKPALLLLHGFPSTSYDWRKEVEFFVGKGYCVIAPDLLGAGETEKPADPTLFRYSAMCADVLDILDAENIGKAIVVGHDWGAVLASRLATRHPERFLAFGFLAVGYGPSYVGRDYESIMSAVKAASGYEAFGYWEFFVEDGAGQVIQKHLDSFVNILYPEDPSLWKSDMAPRKKLKEWVLNDKMAPPPSYISTEELEVMVANFRKNGVSSALNWYKVMMHGIAQEDDKTIPQTRFVLTQPVFYGGCKKDYVCMSAMAIPVMQKFCPDLTIKDFDAGHWVGLEAPDELNAALLDWVEAVITKANQV